MLREAFGSDDLPGQLYVVELRSWCRITAGDVLGLGSQISASVIIGSAPKFQLLIVCVFHSLPI